MRFLFLITLLAMANVAWSQGEDNTWAFGKQAGISFNSGSPVSFSSAINGYGEGCASVSDASGQLLFYTEGTDVWDRNGNLMPNGSDLTSLPYIMVNPTSPVSPTSSSTQGALIVPVPYQQGKYYIFSLSSQPQEMGADAGKLYYSLVDMSLNGGLGDIVAGNKGVLLSTDLDEKMTGVTGDRCNIWVITHKKATNTFLSFEVTSAGVNNVPVASAAGSANPFHYILGTIKVSPDRKRLVSCNTYQLLFAAMGSMELFDFDPATGLISNGMLLDNFATYGAAFSPSSQKLYVSRYNNGQVHQYDISLQSAAAIAASRTLITSNHFTDLRLGPDSRIYMGGTAVSTSPINTLSVITAPDNPPATCGFVADAVPLAANTSFFAGFPNSVVVFRRDTQTSYRSVTVCFSESFQLYSDTLNQGWHYTWSTAETTHDIIVSSSGLYVVRYITPPCVLHVDSFNVSFQSPPPQVVVFPGCKGQANGYIAVTPPNGDTSNYFYVWYDDTAGIIQQHGPLSGDTLFTSTPGTYKVFITGTNGCDTSLTIVLDSARYETAFTVPDFVCITDTLKPHNLSYGSNNYIWDFGDGTYATDSSPVHVYAHPGAYSIILTTYPCGDTAIRTVFVDTMSAIKFNIEGEPFCEGKAILFYPQAPGMPDSLQWSVGNDSYTSGPGVWRYTFETSGSFMVTVTAFFRACPDTSYSDTLTIHPFPLVNLGHDTTICSEGQPLRLRNLQPAIGKQTYLWNNGEEGPMTVVKHPATYCLTVANEWGCSTTDSVEVFKDCYIDIPNAFSPNGDGLNDNFIPRQYLSSGLISFKMQIFNRWGQLIFETTSIDGRGWDGAFNGVAQPAGVYVYLVEASFVNGKAERYQGNVTLLR
jgi:gliding motility-associated-like protein